jgi:hypothetical protein
MGVLGSCDVVLGSRVGRILARGWDGVLHGNDLPSPRTCGNEWRVQKSIRSAGRCADGVQPWERDRPDGLSDVLLPRPGPPADRFGDFRARRARDNFRSNGSNDCGTENAGTGNNAFVRTSFSASSKPHPDRVGPIQKQFRYRDERAIRARESNLPHRIRRRISCFTEFPYLWLCRCCSG